MLEKTHQFYLTSVNKTSYKNIFYAKEISTPIGPMITVADDNYLYACFSINSSVYQSIKKLLKANSAKIVFNSNKITNKTKTQLDKYFGKELKEFSLPLKLTGTDFQKQVWQELREIPYGKTISYLEQATNIGKPKAFRAVANANGKNLFLVIIPCHRVVNSSGKLGGYTGGLDKKKFLLDFEK